MKIFCLIVAVALNGYSNPWFWQEIDLKLGLGAGAEYGMFGLNLELQTQNIGVVWGTSIANLVQETTIQQGERAFLIGAKYYFAKHGAKWRPNVSYVYSARGTAGVGMGTSVLYEEIIYGHHFLAQANHDIGESQGFKFLYGVGVVVGGKYSDKLSRIYQAADLKEDNFGPSYSLNLGVEYWFGDIFKKTKPVGVHSNST